LSNRHDRSLHPSPDDRRERFIDVMRLAREGAHDGGGGGGVCLRQGRHEPRRCLPADDTGGSEVESTNSLGQPSSTCSMLSSDSRISTCSRVLRYLAGSGISRHWQQGAAVLAMNQRGRRTSLISGALSFGLFQVPRSISRKRSAAGANRTPRRLTMPIVRDTSGFRMGRVTIMG
jgi:hypothetical protein